VLVLVGSGAMIQWFGVSAENTEEFRLVLVLFFVGIGLAFPMGIFPEILRGQQRQRIANNLISTALVMRLACIAVAVWLKWDLLSVMGIALFFALIPDVFAAFFALRALPEVRLRPGLFSVAMMRQTMQFSLFAYLNTATTLILGKADQLILAGALSVGAVALYQAGVKIAEVFNQFTRQVQETLSPAAAHLYATDDRVALRDLMLNSIRWSVLIGTPLYLLCAFYIEELLHLLTGDRVIAPETVLVAQVLLLWFYTSLITHSVPKRIFMMCGRERRLTWLGVSEGVANLALSITLVLIFKNVVAVAVGSLLPALHFGWAQLWPWAARETEQTGWELFRRTVLPSWLAMIPMLLVLCGFKFVDLSPADSKLMAMFCESAVCLSVAIVMIWKIVLSVDEKHSLSSKFCGRWPKLRRVAA